jgi:hypothetical protein
MTDCSVDAVLENRSTKTINSPQAQTRQAEEGEG